MFKECLTNDITPFVILDKDKIYCNINFKFFYHLYIYNPNSFYYLINLLF